MLPLPTQVISILTVKPTLFIPYTPGTGHYICRITNLLINDQEKATVFSNYAMVNVVDKREAPSSNPLILQGMPYTCILGR